mmetsp:Transcript_66695/g.195037  ORF Transcript_66695/g.195037 Transcript_66695/m.195037 type:complete len:360 (-) Transcript_66695:823-1902(-)
MLPRLPHPHEAVGLDRLVEPGLHLLLLRPARGALGALAQHVPQGPEALRGAVRPRDGAGVGEDRGALALSSVQAVIQLGKVMQILRGVWIRRPWLGVALICDQLAVLLPVLLALLDVLLGVLQVPHRRLLERRILRTLKVSDLRDQTAHVHHVHAPDARWEVVGRLPLVRLRGVGGQDVGGQEPPGVRGVLVVPQGVEGDGGAARAEGGAAEAAGVDGQELRVDHAAPVAVWKEANMPRRLHELVDREVSGEAQALHDVVHAVQDGPVGQHRAMGLEPLHLGVDHLALPEVARQEEDVSRAPPGVLPEDHVRAVLVHDHRGHLVHVNANQLVHRLHELEHHCPRWCVDALVHEPAGTSR